MAGGAVNLQTTDSQFLLNLEDLPRTPTKIRSKRVKIEDTDDFAPSCKSARSTHVEDHYSESVVVKHDETVRTTGTYQKKGCMHVAE